MLQYSGINVSEGIYVNKTDGSRGFIICHYWYFSIINVRFQPEVCNSCHDLVQKTMGFNEVDIVTVK